MKIEELAELPQITRRVLVIVSETRGKSQIYQGFQTSLDKVGETDFQKEITRMEKEVSEEWNKKS